MGGWKRSHVWTAVAQAKQGQERPLHRTHPQVWQRRRGAAAPEPAAAVAGPAPRDVRRSLVLPAPGHRGRVHHRGGAVAGRRVQVANEVGERRLVKHRIFPDGGADATGVHGAALREAGEGTRPMEPSAGACTRQAMQRRLGAGWVQRPGGVRLRSPGPVECACRGDGPPCACPPNEPRARIKAGPRQRL